MGTQLLLPNVSSRGLKTLTLRAMDPSESSGPRRQSLGMLMPGTLLDPNKRTFQTNSSNHFNLKRILLICDLPHPERSCRATKGGGGETAVVGHGVDREDVPVSNPVEAEYDEVMASSTDGLPFRKSLMTARRRFLKHAEQTADFLQMSRIKPIKNQ